MGKDNNQTKEEGTRIINKTDKDFLILVENNKEQEYEIFEAKDNSAKDRECLRYIKKDVDDYYLVENNNYIKTKLKNEDYNFGWHIFLEEADFSGVTFTKVAASAYEVCFYMAVFVQKANFYSTKFIQKAGFSFAAFQEVDFFSATFEKKADFYMATFMGESIFSATFMSEADFSMITLTKSAKLNFESARFKNDFILQLAGGSEEFMLNLEGVFIDPSNFRVDSLLVEKVGQNTNRITYTILKDVFLKNNDKLTALELYKRELEAHKKELSKKRFKKEARGKFLLSLKESSIRDNLIDRLILWYEEGSSYFGTLVLRALSVWFLIWLVFAEILLLAFILRGSDFSTNIWLYIINPIPSFDYVSDIKIKGFAVVLFLISFFKSIFLSIQTYEVIKSFRKFSRLS